MPISKRKLQAPVLALEIMAGAAAGATIGRRLGKAEVWGANLRSGNNMHRISRRDFTPLVWLTFDEGCIKATDFELAMRPEVALVAMRGKDRTVKLLRVDAMLLLCVKRPAHVSCIGNASARNQVEKLCFLVRLKFDLFHVARN